MQVQSCLRREIGMAAMPWADMSVHDDIKLVRDLLKWADTNANQVALRIGVANTTLNRFANGSAKGRLHRDTIAKLKAAYPAFPGFEVEADLPAAFSNREYLPVEVLPSYAGMGGGGSGDGDREHALVPRRLIEDELHCTPEDLLLIETRGSSMEPDFRHGDQILIDRRDTNTGQPGAFALWDGDAYLIKMVERIGGGRLRVFSRDKDLSDRDYAAEDVTIMGRPVWFGRRL